MSENSEKYPSQFPKRLQTVVWSNKQTKTQIRSMYSDIRPREAANLHILVKHQMTPDKINYLELKQLVD